MNAHQPRRDPRRFFTAAQRDLIASRQRQGCHQCGEALQPGFHVHHVIPWALGGRTEEDNGIAVCPDCHLHAEIRELIDFQPRRWQREAMDIVVPILRAGEFATVSATPGAGKTLYGGAVYRQLRDIGDVGRLVTFVPNTHLRRQWAEEVRALNIFLRADAITEGDREDGVVLGYQHLSDSRCVEQIIRDAAETPTLFILDEVHHLAKDPSGAGAWAVAVHRLVGDYDRPLHRTLNLSGTLFRSNSRERISTIKYELLDDNRIQTVADYRVTAKELQEAFQLRRIKVLAYDAQMEITAIDYGALAEQTRIIRAIDLDDEVQLRSPVLAQMVRDPRYINGILAETVSRLAYASNALEGAPVKALIIADGVDHARQIYAALIEQIGPARAFIAIGSDKAGEDAIAAFRASTNQGIMVAVQKVTEGFDVPDICVLTYLRTWRASLFINQMLGRPMRVTDRERELGLLLPATVLIPNDSAIKEVFGNVLNAMEAFDGEPCLRCGELVCICPPIRRLPRPWRPEDKICNACGYPWRNCICECERCGYSRHTGCICYRFENFPVDVTVVGDIELGGAQVQQTDHDGRPGDLVDIELNLIDQLSGPYSRSWLPRVYFEEFAQLTQDAMQNDPLIFQQILRNLGEEQR